MGDGSDKEAITFTPDIWETIIDFIPDSPRRTLVNLACTGRELCIMLRRRVFSKATFTVCNSGYGSPWREPCWSATRKLLAVLQARPGIAECVKHLEVQVFMTRVSGHSNRVWYYDDFSINMLVPYLTKLRTLSFSMSPNPGAIGWSTLPEEVRSAVHPLLHRVPELRLDHLTAAFAASTRQGSISALESLTVSTSGTFHIGDDFPVMITGGAITTQAPPPHRLKSLTITVVQFTKFADWLVVDNPAFPITINHLETLEFNGWNFRDMTNPDHGFCRVLRRCANVLRSLELSPTNLSTSGISVKASVENIESQRQTYSGQCPDLSLLISLSFLRISGAAIDTYKYAKPQKNFITSIPYIIKTLQTLPHNEARQACLRRLHLYLDIHEFKDYSLKQVDWANFVECLSNDSFSSLTQVFIDITYVYDSSENSNYDRIERVRPPKFVMEVLEGNQDLVKLKRKRGLVLGSTALKRYPGG